MIDFEKMILNHSYQQLTYTKTPTGTARVEDPAGKRSLLSEESEAVPVESGVYVNCEFIEPVDVIFPGAYNKKAVRF